MSDAPLAGSDENSGTNGDSDGRDQAAVAGDVSSRAMLEDLDARVCRIERSLMAMAAFFEATLRP